MSLPLCANNGKVLKYRATKVSSTQDVKGTGKVIKEMTKTEGLIRWVEKHGKKIVGITFGVLLSLFIFLLVIELTKFILCEMVNHNRISLIGAVAAGRYVLSKLLIVSLGDQLDINSNIPSNVHDFKTAIHFAAEGGYRAIIKLLLRNGADINVTCKNTQGAGSGRTPLFYAASKGGFETVKLLMAWGVELYQKDESDASLYKRDEDGDLVFQIDNQGDSVLHFTCKECESAEDFEKVLNLYAELSLEDKKANFTKRLWRVAQRFFRKVLKLGNKTTMNKKLAKLINRRNGAGETIMHAVIRRWVKAHKAHNAHERGKWEEVCHMFVKYGGDFGYGYVGNRKDDDSPLPDVPISLLKSIKEDKECVEFYKELWKTDNELACSTINKGLIPKKDPPISKDMVGVIAQFAQNIPLTLE